MANIFYIIGSSGAGKDSLINYLQNTMPQDTALKFVQRYITRPADAGGENHMAISKTDFLIMKQQNNFAMDWFSHETYYGISIEINHWLSTNYNVIMNGSRGYLQEALIKYPNMVPVLISVDPLILSERLFSRGRENYKQIQQRVAQAIRLENSVSHPHLEIIENNGELKMAGTELLNLINQHMTNKCA